MFCLVCCCFSFNLQLKQTKPDDEAHFTPRSSHVVSLCACVCAFFSLVMENVSKYGSRGFTVHFSHSVISYMLYASMNIKPIFFGVIQSRSYLRCAVLCSHSSSFIDWSLFLHTIKLIVMEVEIGNGKEGQHDASCRTRIIFLFSLCFCLDTF